MFLGIFYFLKINQKEYSDTSTKYTIPNKFHCKVQSNKKMNGNKFSFVKLLIKLSIEFLLIYVNK